MVVFPDQLVSDEGFVFRRDDPVKRNPAALQRYEVGEQIFAFMAGRGDFTVPVGERFPFGAIFMPL